MPLKLREQKVMVPYQTYAVVVCVLTLLLSTHSTEVNANAPCGEQKTPDT